ncbi:GNAT domain-containing protein [Paraphoma chrysanthemicola]|uniref:GNAT domain-containing protein n=1 Tax=Paraphoma chrysanthemicola TaxID=798071 RepID=A0A8K0QWH5_9PLEO|nr:GNAT domain-containing protein [Paraphoma chrysanthemicola]
MVVVDPKYVARTERLVIRPLKLEDAEDVVLMRRDSEVMKHTPLLPCDDLEKTKEWIQGCHDRDNNWNFAVELITSSSVDSSAPTATTHPVPRVIGLIGAVRAPEIGYMFNSSYWGKGYATEALRGFMPMFFEHYKEDAYAEALADTELFSSQSVLLKAGFKLHEKREKDFENPILGLRDTLVFRMERPMSTRNTNDI